MTMRSALWKRDASSRIFSQAVTSAGVIGSPETPLYFAFIVSASNSGSHSCQTSSVSTTMSTACVIYSRRKASTSAREAEGTRPNYPAIRDAASGLLEAGHINDILAANYARLLVDEYQDCSVRQHA